MAGGLTMAENRRRNRKKKEPGAGFRGPWGSLLAKKEKREEFTPNSSFYTPDDEDDEGSSKRPSLLFILWQRFNFWAAVATLLFLLFTGVLALLVVRMWTPQPLHDVAGFTDRSRGEDLSMALGKSNGEELIFTEGEINRYLKDTCRMRQTGIFSIIAHAQGVAVRIHNGYAELIIDRLLGANIHQTTAVHLTFSQHIEHGRPVLRAQFRGGAPILGNMPRGGSIGRLAVPERHIQMLQPALETLLACYPDVSRAVEEHGYLPHFVKGGEGEESYVRLVPHVPQQ